MSWVAVAGAAVSVVGSAVVANNNKPSAPTPRNLGGELGNIGSQYPSILGNYLGGNQSFTNSSLGNLGTLLRGNPYIDSTGYYNSLSPDDKANIDKAGADQGVSGIQWLNGHFLDTMGQGDPVAQAMFKQYGGYSGGLLDLEQGINTATRTNNLNDAINLGGQYVGLTRAANQPYYNALNSYTTNAFAPVQQSATQQQAANMASTGYGQFDPSGLYANNRFSSQTVSPAFVSAQSGTPLLSQLNAQAITQGPSALQQSQNSIAQQLLAQGGQLSPSELRDVQQTSRNAFAARGLDATNASVVDEALQTDAAQRARLQQNLGIAQGVQNQGLAELGQQQQFGLNVQNQNFGYGQLGLQGQLANQSNLFSSQQANQAANLQAQNLGLQAQQANQSFGLGSFNANLNSQTQQQNALFQSAILAEQQRQSQLASQAQAVGLQRQGFLDPYAAITSGADTNFLGQLLGTNQSNQATQSNLYAALLGYGQDLNNTNYNANAAAGIAGFNAQNQLYGAGISAAGNIFGQYLSNRPNTTTTTTTDPWYSNPVG